jgi:16S rRNA (uracil1498-N3)-methyltransferase
MASLSLFFHDGALQQGTEIPLAEDTARHVVQVLRMQPGHKLELTDGKGHLATASVARAEKKKCSVLVEAVNYFEPAQPQLHMAIAFTKNASRNEWLLEKATEMGIRTIIPLVAARTEREKIRYDRWNNILVSAMMQSQQYHLPELKEAMPFKHITEQYRNVEQKVLAHCIDSRERKRIADVILPHKETLILIGPEGDFTDEEVALCEAAGFAAMSMGTNRLRTETAAMAACAYFNMINHAE